MQNELDFLRELTDLDGVPGNEYEVKHYMANKFEEMGVKPEYDGLGSVIGQLIGNPNGPIIMASGHMDEVGFMISKITKEGFLEIIPLGGWSPSVVSAHEVTVTTRSGKKYNGVVGSLPPHAGTVDMSDRQKFFDSAFIDVGAKSDSDVKDMGIRKGDMVTPYIKFKVLGLDQKHLLAKAFDCRIGCAMVIEVMKNLKREGHPNTFAAVGTTQEEVGCRGAGTAAYFVGPQIGFSFDVGVALDTPGCSDNDGKELEKGPQIYLYDAGTIGNTALFDFVCEVGDELKIPYQKSILKRGGTDASKISTSKIGAPSLSIGIPARYIHSHTSMIHYDDYINAVRLMTEVIKRLDKKKVQEIWEK